MQSQCTVPTPPSPDQQLRCDVDPLLRLRHGFAAGQFPRPRVYARTGQHTLHWLKDPHRDLKMTDTATADTGTALTSVQLTFGGASSALWDDQELVHAYDAAMSEFHVSIVRLAIA